MAERRVVPSALALVLLAFAAPGIATASPSGSVVDADAFAGVRLVSSDLGGVTLDVAVPVPRLLRFNTPNGEFTHLDLPGWDEEAAAGHPLLPVTTVSLAVPEGAVVSVDASGEDARLYEGVRLQPQQARPRPDAGDASRDLSLSIASRGRGTAPLVLDAAAYGRAGYAGHPVASLAGIAHLRAQRVARVTLRPADYDPVAGRVRVWSRLRVRVSFAGGTAAAPGAAGTSLFGTSAPGGDDAFEPVYRRALLNYDSGKAWRRDLGAQSLRRRGLQPNAAAGGSGPLGGARQDFTASPNWVRLTLSSKGAYRVDPSDLAIAGVNVTTIDPRTLRIFVKAGQPVLDEKLAPSGWLSELAINVVGESDGTFDPIDYLLFVGLGASGWRDDFEAPGSIAGWLNHPYETANTYWLTWGGAFVDPPHRWTTRSGAPEMPTAVQALFYPARQHFEFDFSYKPDLQEGGPRHAYVGTPWEKWIWLEFGSNSPPIQLPFSLPGAVESEPGRVFVRLWSTTVPTSGPRLQHYTNVTINDVAFAERTYFGLTRQDYDTTVAIRETGNRLILSARAVYYANSRPPPDSLLVDDKVALFWYDVSYARRFQPTANVLDFRSPAPAGPVGYGLGPFTQTTGFLLLDTSDPLATQQVTGIVERDTTGGKAIYFHDDGTSERHFLAVSASGVRKPDTIQRVAIDDLVSPANGADYVVITYDGFLGPANDLAAYRATRLPNVPNPRTRVVKISDIYAWYSGGRTDPTAIRNFLYDAILQVGWSPAPSTVCFLGDASYDFKNTLRVAPAGQPPALVPAYVNGYQSRQFMTDDWLVDLDLGISEPYRGPPGPGTPDSVGYDLPDLMTGRLPASNLSEAQFVVDGKVIPYESSPTWGEWRDRGMLLADDTIQGLDENGNPAPDPLTTQHLKDSEILANAYIPDVVDERKIYMVRYPFGSGLEKPAVNRDVEEAVNEGVVFWNYIGHGNPFKMADENAFILSDVSSLTNLDKPTFVVAASCDLGKFDDAIVTGLGEALLKSTVGGAIATFSASDIAFAFANANLSRELFAQIFTETPEGFTNSLGASVLAAKLRRSGGTLNDLKYILMGDPAQRLALPQHQVRMTLTDDVTGAPLDSLRRGGRVRVRGEVHSSHDPGVDALLASYNGVASLLVSDAPPVDSVQVFPGSNFYEDYRYDPGTVFRGDVPVTNGRFEAVFIMPLESIAGPGGRVRGYVSNQNQDGAGAQLRGVAPGAPAEVDSIGPTIALAFTSGTNTVPPDAVLRIVVRDEHGILLTGHSLPNALYLTIDGAARYDLTEDFRYDAGSYQQGVVEFRLPGLDPGAHTIVVSAADNFAQGVLARRNRSTAAIDFEVEESSGFTLGQAYNFPNPFTPDRGTTFVITGLNEDARVVIKVHTVSGSLVRTLMADATVGQAQIFWDGNDAGGDRVANGAYTYQVEAQSSSGRVVRFNGRLAALR